MINTQQYFIEHVHEMEDKVLENWTPRMLGNGVNYNDLKRIQERMHGWDDWPGLWEEFGDIHLDLAEKAADKGHMVTAGEEWRVASLYYHFGSFMLFDKPEEKTRIHNKCLQYYEKGLKYLRYPGKKVEIPFLNTSIPAYYRESSEANGRLVLLIPGADATKEEASFYDEIFLSRGISTLTIDGPGQGEMQERGVYLRKKTYDDAVRAVVKYMKQELHYDKLGVYGISLGGYLAPRAACVCPDDFMAAVGVAGPYKQHDMRKSGPMFPADFSHVMGVPTLEELMDLIDEINLDDVIANMTCSLLIIHGEMDRIVKPEHAHAIMDGAVNCKDKTLAIIPGANHVCNSHSYIFRPMAGDFMVDHLVEKD